MIFDAERFIFPLNNLHIVLCLTQDGHCYHHVWRSQSMPNLILGENVPIFEDVTYLVCGEASHHKEGATCGEKVEMSRISRWSGVKIYSKDIANV